MSYGLQAALDRDPKEFLICAQSRLIELRMKLPIRKQAEWEDLTAAVDVLQKCLKLLERE